MPKPVVVVGSANVDFTLTLPRLPRKGESVSGGPLVQSFGGKGSNQAVAARRAGADVAVVFDLGDDVYADQLLRVYADEGIDAARVARHPGVMSGAGVILVDAAGDNAIATAWGANGLMTAERAAGAEELVAGAALLMLQMEIPDAAVARAVAAATAHRVPVMLNYAPARESSLRPGAEIDILIVNETEAAALVGTAVDTAENAAAATRTLARAGHRLVVVTLGAAGSVVWENGDATHYPAFAVRAIDATGAGDAYCGALAAALVAGAKTADAVRFATAAGALCAEGAGALPSLPRKAAIEEFLAARQHKRYK